MEERLEMTAIVGAGLVQEPIVCPSCWVEAPIVQRIQVHGWGVRGGESILA